MRAFRSRHSPVGLDIGARRVKAVQHRHGRDEALTALFRRASAASEIDQAEVSRILGVLERRGFHCARVALLAPKESVLRHVIGLPGQAEADRDQSIVRNELARTHGVDGEGLEIAYWPLPECPGSDGTRQVMACAMQFDRVSELATRFRKGGSDLIGVDLTGPASVRGTASGERCVLHVDTGWTSASVVVSIDGVPVYERADTTAGVVHALEEFQAETGLSPDESESLLGDLSKEAGNATDPHPLLARALARHAERVAESVSVSLDFAEHRYGLADRPVVRVAGGAPFGSFVSMLRAATGLEVGPLEADPGGPLALASATARRWAA